MGKGDARRPQIVSEAEMTVRWVMTFGRREGKTHALARELTRLAEENGEYEDVSFPSPDDSGDISDTSSDGP